MTNADLVRAYFNLWLTEDRAAVEAAITEDFRFSSPRDDRIDRAAYFQRCWPNAGRIADFELEDVVESGDRVFVRYVGRRSRDGSRFRNTEVFRLQRGKIAEVDVYFGRDLDARADARQEVRARLEEKGAAIGARDARRAAALYAPEARSFDLAPPLQTVASPKARVARFEEWFATWESPIEVESRDVKVEVDGDLAAVHSLLHMTGTKRGGKRSDLWFRDTTLLRRIDGQWFITHEHDSVPFDMTTFAASLDLEP